MKSLLSFIISWNNGFVPGGTKQLLEPILTYCQLDFIQFESCMMRFIKENAFELLFEKQQPFYSGS